MSPARQTARIHLVLARTAPVIAVFRRGPSKQVALLSWSIDTDAITLGQWLKGRIYARRADLSPDGRHLIYFAANHRPSGPYGGSWTAVSRMPFLTALHVYGWGHCWNGGGLFVNDRDYWLNGGAPGEPDAQVPCGLRRVMTPPGGVTPHMGEDAVTYFPQLMRDGWTAQGNQARNGAQVFLFRKPICPGWTLEKTFHAGVRVGRWGECYSETHRLIGPDGQDIDMPDAETADTVGGDIFYAAHGCLFRQGFPAGDPGEARLIADLNDMTFTPATADYAGAEPPMPDKSPKSWHPLDRNSR